MGSSEIDLAAHLDGATIAEIEGDSAEGVIQIEGAEPDAPEDHGPEPLDKEAFYQVFKMAFALPASFKTEFAPLAVQPQEEQSARTASDALYELLEIYFPSALTPDSPIIGRLALMLPFVLAKVAIAREIFAARKEAARMAFETSRKQPQGADDGGAE